MKQKPTVKLVGTSDNAFAIIAAVQKGLKKAGYTKEECDQYQKEATAGDYDELLQVTSKWVDIE